jgi:prepilin-type N-terminal cleavage/methylation domain-containing protein
MTRQRPRGFSLIELMVAMAIAGITISIAVFALAQINKTSKQVRTNAYLDKEAQMLIEYIIADAQGAGGGSLRPGGAVTVVNGTAGASDRVTVKVLDPSVPECLISGWTGNHAEFDDAGACCADNWTPGTTMTLVSPTGDLSMTLTVPTTPIPSCRLGFIPAAHPEISSTADLWAKFDGGSGMVVRERSYYLDAATRELRLDDFDLTGAARTRLIAEDVYDFQVALGFDVPNPDRDNSVTNTNSTTDEWLFNATGDAMTAAPLSAGSLEDLRRVTFALTVGLPRTDWPGNTVQHLDGATLNIAGTQLRGVESTATFRNLFIFQ